MRCLTLADALAGAGAVCHFISRDQPGFRGRDITDRGHGLTCLPAPTGPVTDDRPYAHWLGVNQMADAEDCKAVLAKLKPDWIVVDHYALDAECVAIAAPTECRVLVIDDLADRAVRADLLLNQNLGASEGAYATLVSPHCQRLVGSQYALLRPEFAALRHQSLKRRKPGRLDHIVISLGGVDIDNVTCEVLRHLPGSDLHSQTRITIVLGQASPHRDAVEAAAAALPYPHTVLQGISDMAAVLAGADLAIGAAGGSSWERCCLGLPSLILVLADNQLAGARALDAAGAAILLGDARQTGWPEAMKRALKQLARPRALNNLSDAAQQVCAGSGASVVARTMLTPPVALRAATRQDARAVWQWRHADDAWKYYANPHPTPLATHIAWFDAALENDRMSLFIAQQGDAPLAYLRLDQDEPEHPARHAVSICMAPAAKGRGLAGHCLSALVREAVQLGSDELYAVVHRENLASRRLFKRAGFELDREDGNFLTLRLGLSGPRPAT